MSDHGYLTCPRCGHVHREREATCVVCAACLACGATPAPLACGAFAYSHDPGCEALERQLGDTMDETQRAESPTEPARPKVVPITASPKARSNRMWTPLQCLEDAVARVKSGVVNPDSVVVLFVEPDGDGQCTHSQRSSLSAQEEFFWLHVAQQQVLDRMRGD